MKLALIGIAGGSALLGWLVMKLVRDDDEHARHQAWKVDHERRRWSEGEDGQPWNWQEFKKRNVS